MKDFLKDKTYGMISLGCDKNRVDSEKLLAFIKENGCKISGDISKVQILIINTCSFLNASRKESIEAIIENSSRKGGGIEKIVVTGCLPQKFIGELFNPLTEGDVFLGVKDYASFFDALEQSYLTDSRINYVGKGKELISGSRVITTAEHYAYLKIADGCYNHCTYCLIPYIRGKYVSYPMEDLLSEAENLGEVAELIIVAQDVTRYGEDLYGENKLVELLQGLSALKNISYIRLLYCYPDVIGDSLIAEVRNNKKILKYLDIPLQHSEDRILRLMNRKGTRAQYLQLIKKLREQIPSIAIRSTFITGFPTESEEEFLAMLDFINEAKLNNCGFFAYSREKGTAAYKLNGQIPYAVKQRRKKALYKAQKLVSREILSGFVGKTLSVLCDGVDFDRGCFVGRSYLSAPEIDGVIYFTSPFAEQGKIYPVLIEKTDEYDMYGHTVDN